MATQKGSDTTTLYRLDSLRNDLRTAVTQATKAYQDTETDGNAKGMRDQHDLVRVIQSNAKITYKDGNAAVPLIGHDEAHQAVVSVIVPRDFSRSLLATTLGAKLGRELTPEIITHRPLNEEELKSPPLRNATKPHDWRVLEITLDKIVNAPTVKQVGG